MVLPAHILQRLPPELRKNGLIRSGDSLPSASTGKDSEQELWRRLLLSGELPKGGVVELALHAGLAAGTSVALRACAHAQRQGLELAGQTSWCAFVDPSASLYAPGVMRSGLDLNRLLVLQPELESLQRVVLRLVESRVFRLVVVDLVGAGRPLDVDLGVWVRVVRRLGLALEGSEGTAILLTDQRSRRPVPLPVAQRLELRRNTPRELLVSVPKDRRGHPCGPMKVAWPAASQSLRPQVSQAAGVS